MTPRNPEFGNLVLVLTEESLMSFLVLTKNGYSLGCRNKPSKYQRWLMFDTNRLPSLRISMIFLGRKQMQKYSKKGHHPLSTVTDTFKK
jgi:hypothetical protein